MDCITRVMLRVLVSEDSHYEFRMTVALHSRAQCGHDWTVPHTDRLCGLRAACILVEPLRTTGQTPRPRGLGALGVTERQSDTQLCGHLDPGSVTSSRAQWTTRNMARSSLDSFFPKVDIFKVYTSSLYSKTFSSPDSEFPHCLAKVCHIGALE